MSGCTTCGGFGDRHDPVAHDWGHNEPWPSPWPDDLLPVIRTHDWLGLGEFDRCGDCFIRLDECAEPCPDRCTCGHTLPRHDMGHGCIECRCSKFAEVNR